MKCVANDMVPRGLQYYTDVDRAGPFTQSALGMCATHVIFYEVATQRQGLHRRKNCPG